MSVAKLQHERTAMMTGQQRMQTTTSSYHLSTLSNKAEFWFAVFFLTTLVTHSESVLTSAGRDFVVVFPPQYSLNSNQLCLVLTNPSRSAYVNVNVSAPLMTSYKNVALLLSPEEIHILEVSTDVVMTSGGDDVEDKGMHVSSDHDVVVQMIGQIKQIDSSVSIVSSGATVIYPTASLQNHYIVVNRCVEGNCYLIVVATSEGSTNVIIGVHMEKNHGSASLYSEGTRYRESDAVFRTIQQFQVMQLWCDAGHCSMSGTTVLATKPVAVFVVAESNRISYANDMTMEQVPPIYRPETSAANPESYTYILAPIVPPDHSSVDAKEDVDVALEATGTTVQTDTGVSYTSTEDYQTHSFSFGSHDVMTMTSDRYVNVAQYTDAGNINYQTISNGDVACLMPIPLSYWGSTVLVAAPQIAEFSNLFSQYSKYSLTLVVESWQTNCLCSTSEYILQDLLLAASSAVPGQVAVLRTTVTAGQSGVVITSTCGPIWGYVYSWSNAMGNVVHLSALGAEYEVTCPTTTTTTATTTTTESAHEILTTSAQESTHNIPTTSGEQSTNDIPTTSGQKSTHNVLTTSGLKGTRDTPTTSTQEITQESTHKIPTTPPLTTTTTTTNTTRQKAGSAKLCPCSATTRDMLATLETVHRNSANNNAASLSSSVAEEAAQNVSAELSVEKEALSKTRRAKFSEGDKIIAYGISGSLAVLVAGMLAFSVYSECVRGLASQGKQTSSSKEKKTKKKKKKKRKKPKKISGSEDGDFIVLDSGNTVQQCWL